jgi:hypothetical protein
VAENARIRTNVAGDPVVDSAGRVHFATTAYNGSSALPKAVHLIEADSGWYASVVPAPGGAYPRLTLAGPADIVYVGLGAVADSTRPHDSNSVFTARFSTVTGRWGEAVPVSYSGSRPAFEPSVVATSERVDVVWTRDMDANRQTREALWHAFSTDSGHSWSEPMVVVTGGHLQRPRLSRAVNGNLLLAYARSPRPGTGATLHFASLADGAWARVRGTIGSGDIGDFALAVRGGAVMHLVFSRPRDRDAARVGTFHSVGSCGVTDEETQASADGSSSSQIRSALSRREPEPAGIHPVRGR